MDLPPPDLSGTLFWHSVPPDGVFSGCIHVDGSCTWPEHANLRRGGSAAVMLEDAFPFKTLGVVFGPAPLLHADSYGAELYAVLLVLRFGAFELTIVIDCKAVKDDFDKGKDHCTASRHPRADLWREVWAHWQTTCWRHSVHSSAIVWRTC